MSLTTTSSTTTKEIGNTAPLSTTSGGEDEFDDYFWLCALAKLKLGTACALVSRGLIPGVVRIGDGRLTRFHKPTVLAWLRNGGTPHTPRSYPNRARRRRNTTAVVTSEG